MADDYATAVRMYDLYLAAEESILTGQSVSMGGRTLTRADLGAVARERKSWGEKKASPVMWKRILNPAWSQPRPAMGL